MILDSETVLQIASNSLMLITNSRKGFCVIFILLLRSFVLNPILLIMQNMLAIALMNAY